MKSSGVAPEETVVIFNEITHPIARLVAAHLPGSKSAIFYISPVHPTLEEPPMRLVEAPVASVWGWLPKIVRWGLVAKTMMESGLWVRPWLEAHRVGAGLEADDDDCLAPEDSLRLHLLPPLLHQRPSDWDDTFDICPGTLDGGAVFGGSLPADLEAWIKARPSEPPIFIGFGSMTALFTHGRRSGENQLQKAIAACAKLRRRCASCPRPLRNGLV